MLNKHIRNSDSHQDQMKTIISGNKKIKIYNRIIAKPMEKPYEPKADKK